MMDIFTALIEQVHGAPLPLQVLMVIVFLCKIITPLTPTKVDDIWFGKLTPFINLVLKWVNIGSLNVGKDKNFDIVKKEVIDAKAKLKKRATVDDVLDGLK
jgi:nucleoside permease NupC